MTRNPTKRLKGLLLVALLTLPLTIKPALAEREMEGMDVVVLKTIDKLSARTHTFDIPVDKTVKFGNSLFIKARACRKSSPLDLPENAAFLQIWERKPEEDKAKWIFSGWMFASNPSVSAMDHPVYDVWVVDCKNNTVATKAETFSTEKAPVTTPEKDAAATAAAANAAPAPATDSNVPAGTSSVPVPTAPPAVAAPTDAQGAKPVVPPLDKLPSSFENEGTPADTTD